MRRPAGSDIATIAAAAAGVALAAQVSVPMPGSPVPVTLQTLAGLAAAGLLGGTRGGAALTSYLAAGAVGIPVFAGGKSGLDVLFGPTGGYLLAFPVAAALVGAACARWRHPAAVVAIMVAGHAAILGIGAVWLARFVDADAVLMKGWWPFLPGAAAKSLAAAAIVTSFRPSSSPSTGTS